jgi:hypothetical protein
MMEKENDFRKELGKYFLDISKLVFGGSVLASIMKIEDASIVWIFVLGSIATIIFAIIGFITIKKK